MGRGRQHDRLAQAMRSLIDCGMGYGLIRVTCSDGVDGQTGPGSLVSNTLVRTICLESRSRSGLL